MSSAEVVEEVAQAAVHRQFTIFVANMRIKTISVMSSVSWMKYLTETNDLRNPPFYTLSTFPRTLTFALNLLGRRLSKTKIKLQL
jgi:hypothetical protein